MGEDIYWFLIVAFRTGIATGWEWWSEIERHAGFIFEPVYRCFCTLWSRTVYEDIEDKLEACFGGRMRVEDC